MYRPESPAVGCYRPESPCFVKDSRLGNILHKMKTSDHPIRRVRTDYPPTDSTPRPKSTCAGPPPKSFDFVSVSLSVRRDGTVDATVEAPMWCLHDRYYSKATMPPLKVLLGHLAHWGVNPVELERIRQVFQRRLRGVSEMETFIDSVFGKSKK